jgi:alkylation response protein AidB-like acyl-CoA dehydrogenase
MNKPLTRPARPASSSGTLAAADAVAALAFAQAGERDRDGAFPEREVAELHRGGLLKAPLPRAFGGDGLEWPEQLEIFRRIGGASLPLGRLYEGHVNALALILRYGGPAQIGRMAGEVAQGRLHGVWNTDDANGLRLLGGPGRVVLQGRKILCSGAGRIRRPIVTALDDEGGRWMITPGIEEPERADLSSWTAQGMRASATGAVDFSGLRVHAIDRLGGDGDYERQPFFSAGAWRFCAVQQGAMERLLDLLRGHLVGAGRGGDPHQAARLGEAALAVETARLWVERAARLAEDREGARATEATVAYVNLARLAVERAALTLLELVQRSVGLQSFMRPNPIERISRDLATYLRQPGPDRALTSAAAFVLAQEEATIDLWQ